MIRVENATKLYGQTTADGAAVHALNGVNLRVAAGEFVSIMGPSGCGKSTLLHVLGGLDRLTSGEIFLDEVAIHRLDENGLTDLRRRKIGFIFQFFNLLPTLTVEENVRLPGLLQKVNGAEIEERSTKLLESVGLAQRAKHRLHQLSGGEMQRAALARALLLRPPVLLADEPTGNLDSRTGEEVLELFKQLHARGRTILIVTHDANVARHCPREIYFRDGRIAAPPEPECDPPAESAMEVH
jgi:putative ABC transport system ATP-binding protein